MQLRLLISVCGIGLELSRVLFDRFTQAHDADPFGAGRRRFGGRGPAPIADELVPQLVLEPATLDFGQAVVGTPSRGRVAIVNTGDGTLQRPLSSLMPGSDPAFSVLHDQCENPVRPGERCDVLLQLLPAAPGPSLFLQCGYTADPGFATVGGDLDDADPTVQ